MTHNNLVYQVYLLNTKDGKLEHMQWQRQLQQKRETERKKLPTGVLSLSREQEITVTTTQLYNKFEQQLEVLKLAKLLLTVK